MAVTADSIRTRFPGVFANTAEMTAALDAAIAEAYRTVNTTRLGSRAEDAVLYLSAHLVEANKPGRAGGATSYSAGSVSMSFSALAAGADDLESTAFGRRYLSLLRSAGGMSLAGP